MIAIKIISIVLQFSLFVMCTLSCMEDESKALGFCAALWLICAILNLCSLLARC
nr:MAG TPA: hypothetical protein [Caudoviricetes sp.]